MGKIKQQKYIFQIKRATFAEKIFKKGLNAAGFILLGLKNFGNDFLKNFALELPKKDSRFTLLRALLPQPFSGFKKATLRVNFSRLLKSGLIEKSEKEKVYCLTDKGEEFILYIQNRYSILKKPWDGKVRLVVFDISEKNKWLRNWLRKELLLMQFKPLQKSVYIGKYPIPEDLYQEIIKNKLFENVYVFTIEKVDKEDQILQFLNE
jgi:CRISPR/Cas system-associated endoribonuclease Cas2